MLDVRALITKGLELAGPEPVLLAAPFHVPDVIAREFVRNGQVAGVVVEGREQTDPELRALGRWVGTGHSRFQLEPNVPKAMLFLGTRFELGGRILLECARRRIGRIYHLEGGGGFASLVPWMELKARAVPLILSRVGRLRSVSKAAEMALGLSRASFAEGYRELIEQTEYLRLPADAFDSRHAMLFAGSLGPGGAERQIAYCARGIARAGGWRVGAAVENLTPPLGNFHEATIREAGAEVHLIPMSGAEEHLDPRATELLGHLERRYGVIGLHNVAHNVLSIAFFLRQTRPGLVHTWMDASNVRVGLAAAITGIPHLVMFGRSVAPDHFMIFQPYMREGYRALMERSRDAVLLNNSRAGATDYARWLGIDGSKIAVIPNGFEFPETSYCESGMALRRSLGWNENHVVLGGLLRFSEEKRPGLWVDVAEQFVEAAPHHRAVAYGDGPLREQLLDRIASRGLSERIKLPGITKDAWSSLAAASLFLLTSRMEGLPNVLIEAQAVEVPVVSVAVGGAPETFEHSATGVLVTDQSPRAIAEACLALARDPERLRAMGAVGREFVQRNFSAERMVKSTLALYEQVVSAGIGSKRNDG